MHRATLADLPDVPFLELVPQVLELFDVEVIERAVAEPLHRPLVVDVLDRLERFELGSELAGELAELIRLGP